MKKTIGIDFDNTIINYNQVFYEVALKKKIIKAYIQKNKDSVKKYLLKNDKYDDWVKLQGEVYSKYIKYARPFLGSIETITLMLEKKFEIFIISHKTKYPYSGQKINLQKPALRWIKKNVCNYSGLSSKNVIFCETKDLKIQNIKKVKCIAFIDDLEQIFKNRSFPKRCMKILLTKRKKISNANGIHLAKNWKEIKELVNDKL